ncbi:restriction endonuclease [Prescottella equi]|uniref:5-methylcytosine-specific restriction endonuclease system specificity protein McrC n=1 Tax=Rhodococcus hoagii TaxID=43767 RepID=UPI0009F04FAB|nr:5-methylcytosine-specific restriction endonuclease system specificity protein McrC [Prescottella equi]OQQ30046.1 restriction endonuclease [Prescottella equi]
MTGVIVSGRTRIPVRNLWLLMLYASDLYRADESLRRSGVEGNPEDLCDIVAEILADAVETRLQRTLGHAYRPRRAHLTRVRGQIDVLETETRQLLSRGRVACRFTELSVDNPRNRLLRTALAVTAGRVRREPLAVRCRRLADTLVQAGVSPRPISRGEAAGVALGRNDVADVAAVDAAKLLLAMDIPAEDDGAGHRWAASRDVAEMRRLYEAAVRGFYLATLSAPWRVHPGERKFRWPIEDETPRVRQILPVMRADTVLETATRRIVVETKFTDALKPNQYDAVKLGRGHLFQLYAYIQSQHEQDALAATAEGVLLYPTVGEHLDESVTIQGHHYRFLTVDLAGSAADIRAALTAVTEDRSTEPEETHD